MLLTFGHGTATAERMTELLQGAGVAVLVDVRTAPGSRRHPHVGRIEEHRLSPGLRRRDDGLLVYDAGQPTLL
jgi:uncharacterized protein (DUF488 family)